MDDSANQASPTVIRPSVTVNPVIHNPVEDSTSIYYIHPGDIGICLSREQFIGENYLSWSKTIMINLQTKNKIAFVDGLITVPSVTTTDPVSLIALQRNNSLVLSWLMMAIAPDIRNSLLYITVAYEAWEELRSRYVKCDGPWVF